MYCIIVCSVCTVGVVFLVCLYLCDVVDARVYRTAQMQGSQGRKEEGGGIRGGN